MSGRIIPIFLLLLTLGVSGFLVPAIPQSVSDKFIITSRHYSVEDGLASREIFCALQDSKGFMWFGTRNGLNRFDGSQFKLYNRQTHGLADNKVIQLAEAPGNRLIIIYGHPSQPRAAMKIEVMDLKTNRIQTLKEAFPSLPFKQDFVFWVANDADALCFLVNNPLEYWRLYRDKFRKVSRFKIDTPESWGDTTPVSKAATYTSMGQYCHFYNLYAVLGNKTHLYLSPDTSILSVNEMPVLMNKQGHLLSRNDVGALQWIMPDGSRTEAADLPYEIKLEQVFSFGNTRDILDYSPSLGLTLYNDSASIPLLISKDLAVSTFAGIYGFFKDAQHQYWICTSGGLYKIKIQRNRFEQYFTKTQLAGQKDNQVRGIATDGEGNIYANLWRDVHVTNHTHSFVRFQNFLGIQYALKKVGFKLYAGSQDLLEFNTPLIDTPQTIKTDNLGDIWAIEPINDSLLVVGSKRRAVLYHPLKKQFEELAVPEGMVPPIQLYRVTKKKNNHCLVVAENGLYILDVSLKKYTDYFGRQATDSTHKIPIEAIYDACDDGAGHFWIATSSQGLYQWDSTTHKLENYNTVSGLPSDILYRIEPDRYQHIWISSDNGLIQFGLNDHRINTYTTQHGITHNEFNRGSSHMAADGSLYFGGLDGVTAFDPSDFAADSVLRDEPLQVLSLNQFVAENNFLTDKTNSLQQTGNIVLEPDDRFFTLEFKLLDYADGKLNYAYRIDGIDQDWNQLPNNSLRISGLASGKYILRVKGQNSRGQWSAKELAIPLEIKAHIWQKNWFKMLVVTVLAAGIWLFFKYRTHRLQLAKQALERTVDKRTQQLQESLVQKDLMMKEIHHRVKNNLQVISGLLKMQQNRVTDEKTKEALTESQNRVLSIAFIHQNLYQHEDLKGVEMQSFVQELTNHIQAVFSQTGRPVIITQQVAPLYIDIDSAIPLGLIINELLTNSFKYAFADGKPCNIKIELFATIPGHYSLIYHDNGCGLPEHFDYMQAKSMGMRLINRLSEQLAGTLAYKYDEGSLFTLHFKSFEERQRSENGLID